MATISRSLSIFILCLGCAWLQSLDHYQSLFCVQDVYGYNLQTTTNLYYGSKMTKATISRSLSIFILCLGRIWLQSSDHQQSLFCVEDDQGYNLQIIINLYSVSKMSMATISRPLSIANLFLGCVWLQCPHHYQSLFYVQDGYGYNFQTTANLYSVSMMSIAKISRPLSFFILCPGCVWLQSPDNYQYLFCL